MLLSNQEEAWDEEASPGIAPRVLDLVAAGRSVGDVARDLGSWARDALEAGSDYYKAVE